MADFEAKAREIASLDICDNPELVTAISLALSEAHESGVSEERERCAKIAGTMGGDFIECDASGDGYREARNHIAAAIRKG